MSDQQLWPGRTDGTDYDQLALVVRQHDGPTVAELAAFLGRPIEAVHGLLDPMLTLGLFRVEGAPSSHDAAGRIYAVDQVEAATAVAKADAERLAGISMRLARMAEMLPRVAAMGSDAPPLAGGALGGEIWSGSDVPALVKSLLKEHQGDLRLVRPDPVGSPLEGALAALAGSELVKGRAVRSLYPVESAMQHRDVIDGRGRLGEQIRSVPSLSFRMMVIGTACVLMPDPLEVNASRQLVVRQCGVVQLATAYFDQLWLSAMPWDVGGQHHERKMLLQHLAEGAKDEQIARLTGLSLRTVRRRVADLMSELGAESRFQAGVEAVRRGWL